MSLPWHLLVPRKGYFKEARVFKLCPEIHPQINKAAGFQAAEYVVMLPMVLLFVVVYPLMILKELGEKLLRLLPPLPDFDEPKRRAIEEAHSILPMEEIRKRLHAKYPEGYNDDEDEINA